MEENQQPGQVIIPHPSGEPPKPAATNPAPAAVQLPAPQSMPAPTTPAAVLPPVPESPQTEAAAPPQSPQAPTSPSAASIPPVAVPAGPIKVPSQQSEPEQVADNGWQFHEETAPAPDTADNRQPLPEGITWTASQFLHHDKGTAWYAILGIGGILAVAGIWLFTKDKITTGIVALTLLAFGVYAGRRPRSEQYEISSQGVQIGAKYYAFQDFKTFSVVDEGSASSVVFMPMKRFMPPVAIYVPAEVEERVVDFLSNLLPVSEHKIDPVDTLLRRIRF